MRRFGIVFLLAVLIVALLGCDNHVEEHEEEFEEEPVTVDIPLYSLSIVDGKVVSDCEYVSCIDIGDKDSFKVLNFADVQLSSSEITGSDENSTFTMSSMERLVSSVEPDMITLTGDQCYGETVAFEAVASKVESFGLPWAPILGNHDCQQNEMTIDQQSEGYRSFSNCLFQDGPALNTVVENNAVSKGHYVVNLVRISGDSFHVVRSLIFMNTGSWQNYEGEQYSNRKRYGSNNYQSLNSNQKYWYRQMVLSAQKYGNGDAVPSGVYLHMPPFVYVTAMGEAFNVSSDVYDVGSWLEETKKISYAESFNPDNWKDGYKESYGVAYEPMAGAPYDEGFFKVVKELGSTDFIICGHEHINNFNIRYEGVNLIYALKTGKGSYWDSTMMGATVVTIASDGSASFENILDL